LVPSKYQGKNAVKEGKKRRGCENEQQILTRAGVVQRGLKEKEKG